MKHILQILLLSGSLGLVSALSPSALGNEDDISIQSQPVNINTASAEVLAEALVGVGLSKAQAIVEYRNKNGRFQSSSQLTQVKGIGERILVANEDRIEVAN